jgi:hypothetical protein
MENTLTLEQRVELIERELSFLKAQFSPNRKKPWWQKITGVFKNDPAFDEILALGQAIRQQERLDARS